MTKRVFTKIRNAVDGGEFEWLQDNHPRIAEALAEEIADGGNPEDICRFIKDEYGTNREGLAKRVRSAARYLQSVQAQSRA